MLHGRPMQTSIHTCNPQRKFSLSQIPKHNKQVNITYTRKQTNTSVKSSNHHILYQCKFTMTTVSTVLVHCQVVLWVDLGLLGPKIVLISSLALVAIVVRPVPNPCPNTHHILLIFDHRWIPTLSTPRCSLRGPKHRPRWPHAYLHNNEGQEGHPRVYTFENQPRMTKHHNEREVEL